MALIIFGILWALRKRFKVPGVLFGIYLIFTGLERFLIEKIRVNVKMHLLGMEPTQAELISVLLMLAGIVLIIILNRKHRAGSLSVKTS